MSKNCMPNAKVRLVGPKARFSTSVLEAPSLPQVLNKARELLLISDIRDGSKCRFGGTEYSEESIAMAQRVRAGYDIKIGNGVSTDSEWRAQLKQHVAADSSAELQVFVEWVE